MQVRYKVLQTSAFSSHIINYSVTHLENKLNELAAQGWEVFQVESDYIYLRKYVLESEAKQNG